MHAPVRLLFSVLPKVTGRQMQSRGGREPAALTVLLQRGTLHERNPLRNLLWPGSMQSEPNTNPSPFQIQVADRVQRLPPYLFGKINDLKYRKRRDGVDVIDLGMGNPTDVPDSMVIEKLC